MSLMARYPSLEGRVVVVTGGASGIGAAIVEAFASQGSLVSFLDIDDKAAAKLTSQLRSRGLAEPTYYRCDLTAVSELQRVAKDIEARRGSADVLVNNAGNDTRHTVESVTEDAWDKIMAVNLKQQFFMTQTVAPAMRAARRGSIVNLSSISWVIPSVGVPVYVTAKAAVVGMTRTLAHEFGADNVRVNCVMPGAIATERQQRLWLTEAYRAEILQRQAIKRLITPEEVARLVLFLGADDSSAITNQSYVIDGGWV
jgi:NAD(P)-dependent dehydrogenase (short-subunit alcohol dehydrogenase family)